jgi:hypothetical protein
LSRGDPREPFGHPHSAKYGNSKNEVQNAYFGESLDFTDLVHARRKRPLAQYAVRKGHKPGHQTTGAFASPNENKGLKVPVKMPRVYLKLENKKQRLSPELG